jgi:hypothetical protein
MNRVSGGFTSAMLLAVLLAGCGADPAEPQLRGRDDAQTSAINVLRAKRPALGDGFLCMRRPPSGPVVELFVTSKRDVPLAASVLKAARIDGSVRTRTIYSYGVAQLALARAIRAKRRGAYSKVEVNTGLYAGELECPRVHIEVGVKGEVPMAVLRWADSEVERYGADRVNARYAPSAVLK